MRVLFRKQLAGVVTQKLCLVTQVHVLVSGTLRGVNIEITRMTGRYEWVRCVYSTQQTLASSLRTYKYAHYQGTRNTHSIPRVWTWPCSSSGQSSWLQIQRSRFDSRRYKIFWEVVGMERGPLSLVSTIEELLGRNNSGSGLEDREYSCRDPSRWPRGTLYPQKLVLISPTCVCLSVGIIRSRTQTTGFFSFIFNLFKFIYCQVSLPDPLQGLNNDALFLCTCCRKDNAR
jgi:hypothetical protein